MKCKPTGEKATYAFVDASNIIYGVLKHEGWKVDLEKLLSYLRYRYNVSKAFYYGGKDPNDEAQSRYYIALSKIGYTLRLKRTMRYHEGGGKLTFKANCDVDLTFDVMRLFSEYSDVVILSGDGDFTLLVRYLIRKKRNVWVIANSNRASMRLKRTVAGNFVDIRKLRGIFEYKK